MSQILIPNNADQSIFPPTADFQSNTTMTFQQTTAPIGWVKQTTHNDKSFRVVSGTAGSGGSTAFSGVFNAGLNTGSHALTVAELPVHSHGGVTNNSNQNLNHNHTGGTFQYLLKPPYGGSLTGADTAGSGGEQAVGVGDGGVMENRDLNHNHNIQAEGSNAGHTHTLSLNLQYVDLILAQKS